ncbi:MAG: holin [Tenuifilaceae bacterium]|nr:holin [Tenuifilaceae bacterium]
MKQIKVCFKDFMRAALVRAVRTVAQTAVATIGAAAVISEVNWLATVSASVLAGILSILMSIATDLPEVE